MSHETIYRSLFVHARGDLKKELQQHLRRTRAMRRSRHHTQKTSDHGRIIDAVVECSQVATKLYKSLTWDRGTEMLGHKQFTMVTDIEVSARSLHRPVESAGESSLKLELTSSRHSCPQSQRRPTNQDE